MEGTPELIPSASILSGLAEIKHTIAWPLSRREVDVRSQNWVPSQSRTVQVVRQSFKVCYDSDDNKS